jgi:hypothetical protein
MLYELTVTGQGIAWCLGITYFGGEWMLTFVGICLQTTAVTTSLLLIWNYGFMYYIS